MGSRGILELLAEYFCLNIPMLARLSRTTERNAQAIVQRLVKDGKAYGKKYETEQYVNGALPLVVGLTDSSVSQAFREGWATNSTKSFRGHALRTVEHEIKISEFHIALDEFAEQNGWTIQWRQRQLDKNSVRPDALFSLNGHYFFLEMERAKLGNYRDGKPQILRKLAHYRDYHDSVACERDFGFRAFRVITVMRTPERVDNLLILMKTAGLSDAIFLVSSELHFFAFHTAVADIHGTALDLSNERIERIVPSLNFVPML